MKRVIVLIMFSLIVLVSSVFGSDRTRIIKENICKKCISEITGRDINIMNIDKFVDNIDNPIIYLSYVRKSDNTKWSYKCKIVGNRVIWGNSNGRWRDSEYYGDSKITYSIDNGKIIIKETW